MQKLRKSAERIFKPHRYQRKTIKFFVERPAAGAFLDPGLGKTIITYCTFDVLRDAGIVKKLFVVTLLRPAYKVWPSEVEKWGLPFKVHILHDKGKTWEALADDSVDVYVINYDGIEWLLNTLVDMGWKKPANNMLVFDESSKLRNTGTQRFKIVRQLIGLFKRRYILTGSPTPKGLMNLFGQIFALDAGERLGRYITHFRNKYFIATPIGAFGPITYDLKAGADTEIYDAISDVVIRFGEEELDMPKLIIRDILVDLPRAARRVYDDLERDLITAVDNEIIVAKNAGVATQKLRQVANGGLYLGDGLDKGPRKWKELHDAKTQAVVELVDELAGKPVLIGYEFHHDLARLRAALPTAVCLTDVNMKEYNKLEAQWNRGEIGIALAQISALAHGNNLQGSGGHIIFHSHVWDYEAYDQFIRRLYRQGQKAKRVIVYRIVAEGTVDRAITGSMEKKGATQNDLFTALKAYTKKRRVK